MRLWIVALVALGISACGDERESRWNESPATNDQQPQLIAPDACVRALYSSIIASSFSDTAFGTGSASVETEIILPRLRLYAALEQLQDAMGPGVTVDEYCASMAQDEIRLLVVDADLAIDRFAMTRGIPTVVARDQIDGYVDQVIANEQRTANEMPSEIFPADTPPTQAPSAETVERELDQAITRSQRSGDWSGWTMSECHLIGPSYGNARSQCLEGKEPEPDHLAE